MPAAAVNTETGNRNTETDTANQDQLRRSAVANNHAISTAAPVPRSIRAQHEDSMIRSISAEISAEIRAQHEDSTSASFSVGEESGSEVAAPSAALSGKSKAH